MLLQFTVKNFMSIKDEVTLSLLANPSVHEHEDILISHKNEKLLPIASIYGANAAGKSNLFRAISTAIKAIRYSNDRQIDRPIGGIIPFAMDPKTVKQPTSFDFIFITKGKKYQYGFSATNRGIIDEYLYEFRTSRSSKIFERSQSNKYSFTKKNEDEFNSYVSKNSPNKLFLSTATSWNCKLTKDAYTWFSESIDVFDSNFIADYGMQILEEGNEEGKEFLRKKLQEADFNIDGYVLKVRETNFENLNQSAMPEEAYEVMKKLLKDYKGKEVEFNVSHSVVDKDGHRSSYSLPFQLESEGTKRMFFYGISFWKALKLGKTIFIDELDTSMHPLLVKFLLKTFNDIKTNPNHAQLIFSTHDVSLLSLKEFRRDQIYFVAKDRKSAVSTFYPLDEFSPRKTENVQRGYLQGRYGAIPVINQEDLQW